MTAAGLAEPAAQARRLAAHRPWWALGCVAALHALLLGLLPALVQPLPRAHAPTAEARAVWLRLLHEPHASQPTRPPERPPADRTAKALGPPPFSPAAPTMAPETPTPDFPPRQDTGAAITSPHAAAPPASATLDLRLPARSLRAMSAAALARDDPRLPPRLTRGERLARALGADGPVHESVNPDGTRVFRRGGTCTVAQPSRNDQLDPFNQSVLPRPRTIDQLDC